MKKTGRILLVIACIVGIAASGVRLALGKQVGKMAAQLDAVAVVAPERVAETPLVKVMVEVTVQDHTLREIRLLRHENGQGAPAEAMLPDMLSRNTSEVDGVSGATLSSKAIRAAVRDALVKGAAD